MQSIPSAESFAIQELERFRSLHLYADRVLIRQGAYAAAALHLERRVRRAQWAQFCTAALYLFMAALALIDYGRAGSLVDLGVACLYTGFALMFVVHGVRALARVEEMRRHVEALFPHDHEAAHAPAL